MGESPTLQSVSACDGRTDTCGSHLVHRLDGAVEGDITVLLVRVVEAGPRHVADPDTEVLDRRWVFLEDLRPAE